jgi:hypothetical protein
MASGVSYWENVSFNVNPLPLVPSNRITGAPAIYSPSYHRLCAILNRQTLGLNEDAFSTLFKEKFPKKEEAPNFCFH